MSESIVKCQKAFIHVNVFCIKYLRPQYLQPSRVAHSVMCLTADTAILLPSVGSRKVVVSYKQKYVHEVLVNYLVKLAQEKVWLGELIA